jgi:hypothetical protein
MSEDWESELWETGYGIWRGLRRRVAATFGLMVGGFVWLVLYAAFLASRFAWYENLAVVVCSLLVGIAAISALWILWGLGIHRRFGRWETFGPFEPSDPWDAW